MDFQMIVGVPCGGTPLRIRVGAMNNWLVCVEVGSEFQWLRLVEGARTLAEAKEAALKKLVQISETIRTFDPVEQMKDV